MFFEGDNSAGVGGDLRNATATISHMIGVYGMGDNIASSHGMPRHALDQPPDPTDKITQTMSAQIERSLRALYNDIYELIEEHKTAVFNVAVRLQEKKTITGREVAEIIGLEAGAVAKDKPVGFAAVSAEDHRIALGLPPIEDNGQAPVGETVGMESESDDQPSESAAEDDQPSSGIEDTPAEENGQPATAEEEGSAQRVPGSAPRSRWKLWQR